MSNPSTTSSPAPAGQHRPWWREYMVWLIIGGPAAVVVASFVTLSLAIRHPDPVLESGQGSSASDKVSSGSSGQTAGSGAYVPAMQGRNHVATDGANGK